MASTLPPIPAKHNDFFSYVRSQPDAPMVDLVKPYIEFDAVMRKKFAQEPESSAVQENLINVTPIYDQAGINDLRIRARDLEVETPEQKEKYLLPLGNKDRKPNGSPAIVPTLKEFRNNFALFTEGCLSEIDWSNVVAAGSAVVTSLLPVPEEYRHSKRGLRKYYHEIFAPASDVDLFLYGLNEEQAIEKIKHIEDSIKNTILYETTTVRTKNTITIASQYPNRHVQIVLRIYRSVSEILTGFDVDVSCAAFDGKQVYASPRAIAAYITQINMIDLTRRSPSYENRLSKYSHRGFEVFWPGLDRSRIDPTIFERTFNRTVGLARLLVLEKLPKSDDRDLYLSKRREERGRPALSMYMRRRQGRELRGNIKDDWEDEVPEWQEQDQVSDYNTFTIPYGRNFNAKKIEKMLYTKDLLLNAQWNQDKNREVYLHRHPAFFGEAEHVIHDCCGFCPAPTTEEEKKVAEEESKIYVSGDISFIKDDPGRQEIGSFNPITETDWTEMAYVGRTERLCQAIVADDLKAVQACLAEEGSNPDRRDYTGRTPLQLACMSSTPEIVQTLVDHGARMIPRMADGKTALHIAASRGDVEIIRILLTKSNQNEEEEFKKQEQLKEATSEKEAATDVTDVAQEDHPMDDASDQDEDMSHTSASYVKVEPEEPLVTYDTIEENELEPDVYDVNVVAWDSRASPLHLAMLNGHTDAVKELVSSFGADVLIPVKILNDYNRKPEAAILNLVLAFALPSTKRIEMFRTLLELGASPAQADLKQRTPVFYSVEHRKDFMLDLCFEHDTPAVKRAINHLSISGSAWSTGYSSVLIQALENKMPAMAVKLLDAGAKPSVEFSDFLKSFKRAFPDDRVYMNGLEDRFNETDRQPIVMAVMNELPTIALELLNRGADPNTKTKMRWGQDGTTVLDCTQRRLRGLQAFLDEPEKVWQLGYGQKLPQLFEEDGYYLGNLPADSYQRLVATTALKNARDESKEAEATIKKEKARFVSPPGTIAKREAIANMIRDYQHFETELRAKGAKTWRELHPDLPYEEDRVHPEKKYPEPVQKKFKLEFHFSEPGLNDVRRDGYIRLFEAAWINDLETIKSLTLGMWGPAADQRPLELAVTGNLSVSCLTISILRGHLDLAKSILEIIGQQYKPKESRGQVRFEIATDESSDDDDDDDNLNIIGDTVDETFTHENVGEVTTHVESEMTPLMALQATFKASPFLEQYRLKNHVESTPNGGRALVSVNSLIRYSIYTNDLAMVNWLLETGQKLASEDPLEHKYWIEDDDLKLAISLGRTEFLAKLIQHSGVGLPLAKLSADSGVETTKEPRYYQGLSIRGAKRSDWANAGRNETIKPLGLPTPLLISAFQGNIASTEFFLGTAPGRYYLEYVNSHPERKDIKRIARSKLGLEGSVLNWLQTRNNLVLHCAVMAKPCEESERLVQYIVDHHPECLEVQSESGRTPLALAFSLRRVKFARILIAAGANQATRDSEANNLLHMLIQSDGTGICENYNTFNKLVGMLDDSLIPTMLSQRAGEDARTPFTHWLHNVSDLPSYASVYDVNGEKRMTKNQIKTTMTNAILDLATPTNQKHLEVFDGAGNTPAHLAVKNNHPKILNLLLERRPDLLYRENSTGTTPLEMAVAAWVNNTTSRLPGRSNPPDSDNIIQRDPRCFVDGFSNPGKIPTDDKTMLRVCREKAEQNPGKRRLVSLFEANEVAKRLATTQRSSENNRGRCYRRRRRFGDCYGVDDGDEVEQWIGVA
ncbi:unnamed protein product [Penicillium salamii]|nr:unnamed protein product [Penicillium salamii]CAG8290633.1 unnamed protein product [Penicillium salamii]